MSNYIRINHSQLEKTASTIEQYIATQNKYMQQANGQVTFLASSWQGQDFFQFQTQWNKVTESGSTSDKMAKALKNYADFLRYAANQYKTAQSDAVNRANMLPNW